VIDLHAGRGHRVSASAERSEDRDGGAGGLPTRSAPQGRHLSRGHPRRRDLMKDRSPAEGERPSSASRRQGRQEQSVGSTRTPAATSRQCRVARGPGHLSGFGGGGASPIRRDDRFASAWRTRDERQKRLAAPGGAAAGRDRPRAQRATGSGGRCSARRSASSARTRSTTDFKDTKLPMPFQPERAKVLPRRIGHVRPVRQSCARRSCARQLALIPHTSPIGAYRAAAQQLPVVVRRGSHGRVTTSTRTHWALWQISMAARQISRRQW
jgi:ribosomal protein S18